MVWLKLRVSLRKKPKGVSEIKSKKCQLSFHQHFIFERFTFLRYGYVKLEDHSHKDINKNERFFYFVIYYLLIFKHDLVLTPPPNLRWDITCFQLRSNLGGMNPPSCKQFFLLSTETALYRYFHIEGSTFIEMTLSPVNLLYVSRKPIYKNTCWGLLLWVTFRICDFNYLNCLTK